RRQARQANCPRSEERKASGSSTLGTIRYARALQICKSAIEWNGGAMTHIRVDTPGLFRSIVIVLFAATLAGARFTPLSAQWLQSPTAGVPKLPNGRPNLNAPPPRAADGKPDLS